jgi:RNA polymerase sigma-70 factor (ECF subfamily)
MDLRSAGFEDFYRSNFARLAAAAFLMTGDREEGADLAQEAFVRAYERWRAVSHHPHPEAWLFRVVANLAVSQLRRERLRSRWKRAWGSAAAAAPPHEVTEPAVLSALKDLTDAQRTVVVLRYYADLSVDQVAEALGKRPGTVRALTSQAFSRLRPILEAKGVHR